MDDVSIRIIHDTEAGVWVAICDDIGLALEAETLPLLMHRLAIVVPEMYGVRSGRCEP